MTKKSKYISGDVLGNNITFICDVKETTKAGARKAKFKCFCGNEFINILQNIKSSGTKSCGCQITKRIIRVKHNESSKNITVLYRTWKNMKTRCFNKNTICYKNYGGRGINIYPKWVKDYLKFKDYILENLGDRPKGYSLDRINNDGNYEPDNLRWASRLQQTNNRRTNAK